MADWTHFKGLFLSLLAAFFVTACDDRLISLSDFGESVAALKGAYENPVDQTYIHIGEKDFSQTIRYVIPRQEEDLDVHCVFFRHGLYRAAEISEDGSLLLSVQIKRTKLVEHVNYKEFRYYYECTTALSHLDSEIRKMAASDYPVDQFPILKIEMDSPDSIRVGDTLMERISPTGFLDFLHKNYIRFEDN